MIKQVLIPMNNRKESNQGMAAIEACILIPLTLVLILMLIWFGFYEYDKMVISQAASMAVIKGRQFSEKSNEEISEIVSTRLNELLENRLILLQSPEQNITVGLTSIELEVTGSMNLPDVLGLGNFFDVTPWDIHVVKGSNRMKKSQVIRTIWQMKEAVSTNSVNVDNTDIENAADN